MKLTSGVVSKINLMISIKTPTEVNENKKIANPNKNLNNPSIYLFINIYYIFRRKIDFIANTKINIF